MALPTCVTCSAGYGAGGLGSHFSEVVDECRLAGALRQCISTMLPEHPGAICQLVPHFPPAWMAKFTPLRFYPDHQQHLTFDVFDRRAARLLSRECRRLMAHAGQSLHSFRAARRLGYDVLECEAATSHLQHVAERHQTARKQYPIERDWLSEAQVRKGLLEYALADRINVASEYSRNSFLRHGVPESKLGFHRTVISRRFRRVDRPPPGQGFHVVYTGALSVPKGVPVLLEAFARLTDRDARLTLVGYTASRGMRRLVGEAMAADPRIAVTPGDPVPTLSAADVYVHPSYQDGFARAAVEALAMRVPVIVTADTGMSMLVRPGENGWIIPSGDVDALVDALDTARRLRLVPPPLGEEHFQPHPSSIVPGRA